MSDIEDLYHLPPRPSRLRELAAALVWIAGSWLRPADSESTWEQHAGRGTSLFEHDDEQTTASGEQQNPATGASHPR